MIMYIVLGLIGIAGLILLIKITKTMAKRSYDKKIEKETVHSHYHSIDREARFKNPTY